MRRIHNHLRSLVVAQTALLAGALGCGVGEVGGPEAASDREIASVPCSTGECYLYEHLEKYPECKIPLQDIPKCVAERMVDEYGEGFCKPNAANCLEDLGFVYNLCMSPPHDASNWKRCVFKQSGAGYRLAYFERCAAEAFMIGGFEMCIVRHLMSENGDRYCEDHPTVVAAMEFPPMGPGVLANCKDDLARACNVCLTDKKHSDWARCVTKELPERFR